MSSGGSLNSASRSPSASSQNDHISQGSWASAGDIATFEVTSLAAPTGEFWEHTRQYAFDQACKEFPWLLNWNKQCPELKARFTLKLRKIYPVPWEPLSVLVAVGRNLRERRNRLKKKFQVYKNWRTVPRPNGCSKESWLKIYEDLEVEKKRQKSALWKAAADARMKQQGFTHRCGPRGLKGLHDQFIDVFGREPNEEESDYGKRNGWFVLEERTSGRFSHRENLEEVKTAEPKPQAPVGKSSKSQDKSTDDSIEEGTVSWMTIAPVTQTPAVMKQAVMGRNRSISRGSLMQITVYT